MTSDLNSRSEFFRNFSLSISQISVQPDDPFHNQLYFSNIITLLEKYLYDLFIFEISTTPAALVKLASHKHFKTMSLPVPYLLHHDVKDHMVNAMKNMVWHKINDVENYYKSVLAIRFNTSKKLLDKLKIRHHLIHRNGFDLDNNKVEISAEELQDCIDTVSSFVLDIDKKYQAYKLL